MLIIFDIFVFPQNNTNTSAKPFDLHKNMRGNPFIFIDFKKKKKDPSLTCAVRSAESHGFKVEIIRFAPQLSSWWTIGFVATRKTRVAVISNSVVF